MTYRVVGSINIRYLDNILLNNLGAGLSHEIGYDAVVAGNWAAGNGKAFQVWWVSHAHQFLSFPRDF